MKSLLGILLLCGTPLFATDRTSIGIFFEGRALSGKHSLKVQDYSYDDLFDWSLQTTYRTEVTDAHLNETRIFLLYETPFNDRAVLHIRFGADTWYLTSYSQKIVSETYRLTGHSAVVGVKWYWVQ